MLDDNRWEHDPWATAYVYFFARDKTNLLLDAVQPLLRQLEPVAPRAYFVRHWRFGPHLRLRFSVDAATFEGTLQPVIGHVIGRYLAESPSTSNVNEAELLRQHRRLAKLEGERGALTPFAGDNTISYNASAPLGQDPEDEAIQRLLADFYVDTTALVFENLELLRAQRASLYDLAFDFMVATSHTLYPSPHNPTITEGFVSFRSHAEAYLAMVPAQATVRQHFEQQYRRFAPTLIRRVRDLIARLDAGKPPSAIAAYLQIARPHIDRSRSLIKTGRLVLPIPHRAATSKRGWDEEWVAHSSFHSLINDSETYNVLFETAWFQQYRMALNLMYLHLNRLGLLPVERYLICHLVANAVEEVFGVSAFGLLGQFVAARTALAAPSSTDNDRSQP
jgi:hypothetical protein